MAECIDLVSSEEEDEPSWSPAALPKKGEYWRLFSNEQDQMPTWIARIDQVIEVDGVPSLWDIMWLNERLPGIWVEWKGGKAEDQMQESPNVFSHRIDVTLLGSVKSRIFHILPKVGDIWVLKPRAVAQFGTRFVIVDFLENDSTEVEQKVWLVETLAYHPQRRGYMRGANMLPLKINDFLFTVPYQVRLQKLFVIDEIYDPGEKIIGNHLSNQPNPTLTELDYAVFTPSPVVSDGSSKDPDVVPPADASSSSDGDADIPDYDKVRMGSDGDVSDEGYHPKSSSQRSSLGKRSSSAASSNGAKKIAGERLQIWRCVDTHKDENGDMEFLTQKHVSGSMEITEVRVDEQNLSRKLKLAYFTQRIDWNSAVGVRVTAEENFIVKGEYVFWRTGDPFGVTVYHNVFTESEIEQFEQALTTMDEHPTRLLANSVDIRDPKRTKYFFNFRYLYGEEEREVNKKSGHHGAEQRAILLDDVEPLDSAQGKWLRNIERLLVERGIISANFVNFAVVNLYRERGAHLGVHQDSKVLFQRPIITVRLFDECVLSFGCHGMGISGTLVEVPQPRGSVCIMTGFAANETTHAVQHRHVLHRTASVLLRHANTEYLQQSITL